MFKILINRFAEWLQELNPLVTCQDIINTRKQKKYGRDTIGRRDSRDDSEKYNLPGGTSTLGAGANLIEMDILEETSFRSEPGSSDCSLDEVLTFSPDLGLSPVTSASSKMGHLNCANRLSHITPRRKLKLSPDSRNTSPTDSTSQNQANMENVTLSGFPKESTPKLKERNLGTEASDSSFETYISKPKKPIRRTILRNNEENATLPGARKKKSRKKLSVMFQCPEEQQKPWPEKGKLAEGTLKNNRTSDSVAILEKLSVNDESPKAFVAASGNSDLIGDFSKPYSLPVQKGKHDDLKYISCGTLVDLISGVYNDVVRRYKVVDCRYPYEYAGGHIQGSWNLYSEEHIRDNFIMHPPLPEKRIIVIFHCEFSSKRGPKLCRSLRNMDRNINKYPYLHYPELYLLKGGYKEFYEKFKSLCVPQAYVNMLHSDYREEYRKFYRICKTGAKRKIRKELLKTQSPHKSTRSETTRTAIIDMIEN